MMQLTDKSVSNTKLWSNLYKYSLFKPILGDCVNIIENIAHISTYSQPFIIWRCMLISVAISGIKMTKVMP